MNFRQILAKWRHAAALRYTSPLSEWKAAFPDRATIEEFYFDVAGNDQDRFHDALDLAYHVRNGVSRATGALLHGDFHSRNERTHQRAKAMANIWYGFELTIPLGHNSPPAGGPKPPTFRAPTIGDLWPTTA